MLVPIGHLEVLRRLTIGCLGQLGEDEGGEGVERVGSGSTEDCCPGHNYQVLIEQFGLCAKGC